jgi:hypothetical protein
MRLCQTCGRLSDDGVDSCPVDGKSTTTFTPSIPIGEKIAGTYTIVAAIGVGQSGEVYEGKAEADGARVVIRVLSEDMTKDKRLSDVVRRHLLKQKEFKHRYVVPICAVDARNERIVVVREWVDGKRLEDALRVDGPLAVSRALDLSLRICSALAESHKVGLLHLQLRASNVFVVAGEEPGTESIRLVDFGIGPRRKIGTRPVYGQPGTLSPEQIEGKIVSFKSDMFSAGMLLYRMLAGHLPWTGDDETVVRQILEAPVPPIKYRVDSPVPVELWAFLRQMLEKKPIHRPIGMAQMGDKLRELHGENAAGRLSVEPPEPDAAKAAATPPASPSKAAERLAIGKIALKPKAAPVEASAEPVAAEPADFDLAIDEGKPETKVEIAAAASADAAPAEAPKTDRPHPSPVETSKAEKPGLPTPPVAAAAHAPARPPPSAAAGPAAIAPKDLVQPKGEELASSSATIPMEPDIIEEAMVPPPLRAPRGGPSSGVRPAPPSAAPAVASAAYKRGLLYGLLAGLAVAIIAFFCAMFLFRGKPTPCPPAQEVAQAPSADAGPVQPRLTAEGPMQVTTVADAGTTAPAADDVSAPPLADVPAPSRKMPCPPRMRCRRRRTRRVLRRTPRGLPIAPPPRMRKPVRPPRMPPPGIQLVPQRRPAGPPRPRTTSREPTSWWGRVMPRWARATSMRQGLRTWRPWGSSRPTTARRSASGAPPSSRVISRRRCATSSRSTATRATWTSASPTCGWAACRTPRRSSRSWSSAIRTTRMRCGRSKPSIASSDSRHPAPRA